MNTRRVNNVDNGRTFKGKNANRGAPVQQKFISDVNGCFGYTDINKVENDHLNKDKKEDNFKLKMGNNRSNIKNIEAKVHSEPDSCIGHRGAHDRESINTEF